MNQTAARWVLFGCFIFGATAAIADDSNDPSIEGTTDDLSRPTATSGEANDDSSDSERAGASIDSGAKNEVPPSGEAGESDGVEADFRSVPSQPVDIGQLPWARTPKNGAPLASRITDAKQLLVNVSPSEFDSLSDGDPLAPDNGTLAKILLRLPRFLQSDLMRLSEKPAAWDELTERPSVHRADVVRIQGRVRRVETFDMPAEMAELFGFSRTYLTTIDVDAAPGPIIVHALHVPEAWLKVGDGSLDERVFAYGLFIQRGRADETSGASPLHFAAERIAWRPDSTNDQTSVSDDEVALGALGVDVGLLREARKLNRRSLEDSEYETFYQMLNAVKHLHDLESAAAKTDKAESSDGTPRKRSDAPAAMAAPFDLVNSLKYPETVQGKRLFVEGRARRITRVVVESADIRERFGIDHYWQIDARVPVGDQPLELRWPDDRAKKDGGSNDRDDRSGAISGSAAPNTPENPTFRDSFPITLCTLELPPELEEARQAAESAGGESSLNEAIEFEGFFYKVWVYRSEYMSQFSGSPAQQSPFFIAYQPRMSPPPPREPWIGIVGGVLILAAIAGVWIAVSRANRRDSELEKRLLARREPSSGKSLDEMELDVSDGPDFSRLDRQ